MQPNNTNNDTARVAIIGAGPAGLMAAQIIAQSGRAHVDVYDAMPSAGRKLLLAGIGGLNITHSEAHVQFLRRYGTTEPVIKPWLDALSPDQLRAWVHSLGIETFVGSSGRVFPVQMKSAPLLRAWLHELRRLGVRFHQRHRWVGFGQTVNELHLQARSLNTTPANDGTTAEHTVSIKPEATVLALGGASWPKLGSDGSWVPVLSQRGVDIAALQPANCGFDVAAQCNAPSGHPQGWTTFISHGFAGAPLDPVVLRVTQDDTVIFERRGQCVVTQTGLEGSLIYAASAHIRDAIRDSGHCTIELDLLPDRSHEWIITELSHGRGKRSWATHLKTRLKLDSLRLALLYECAPKSALLESAQLARWIKALPVKIISPRPISEAISTAGGVQFSALSADLQLHAVPGVFCCGEMLDWEAPTGGYLLNACWASGKIAGLGVLQYLDKPVQQV